MLLSVEWNPLHVDACFLIQELSLGLGSLCLLRRPGRARRLRLRAAAVFGRPTLYTAAAATTTTTTTQRGWCIEAFVSIRAHLQSVESSP